MGRLTKADIHRALEALATALPPSGVAAELWIVGGAAIVLLYGARDTTKDVDAFHRLLGRLVVDDGLAVERVAVADDDVQAVYRYLIEGEGEAR